MLASLDPAKLPLDGDWLTVFRLETSDREATLGASKDDVRKAALEGDFILGR
jgi:hypothetical protein